MIEGCGAGAAGKAPPQTGNMRVVEASHIRARALQRQGVLAAILLPTFIALAFFCPSCGGTVATVAVPPPVDPPAVNLSPASLNFGTQPLESSNGAESVTLTNSGNTALSVTSIAISGANASDFVQTNNCGSSVAAGANCTISVTFTPSASGAATAALNIAENVTGSPQIVSLTGTGTSSTSGQTVNVEPSDNLQSLVNQYPPSTTFLLAPGNYRLQSVVPQNGDSFVGQTGAILSGAALLTSFIQNGAYWTAEVAVSEAASYPGTCSSASPACIYPEDLFFNNVAKTRVTSLSSVAPGTWYLDYSTGTVYMADDPTGSTVEISLLPRAFAGEATSVTISNLTIEKYACVAQSAAVDGQDGTSNWIVEGNEIRYNHGRGISTGNGMQILNNNVHHNGQLGIGGSGSNILVQGNQISYNNYAGYDYTWEAGGAKFTNATAVAFENNTLNSNSGPGFWADENVQNSTVSGNQTSGNIEAGILIEISDGATITNNTIVNDGYVSGQSTLWYGAGILISTSSNITISGNTITNCMNGIGGIYSDPGDNPSGVPYALQNVVATNNTISQSTGLAMGIVLEGAESGNSVYTSMGNNFQDNTFVLTSPSTGLYFYWMGEYMTLATWTSEVN